MKYKITDKIWQFSVNLAHWLPVLTVYIVPVLVPDKWYVILLPVLLTIALVAKKWCSGMGYYKSPPKSPTESRMYQLIAIRADLRAAEESLREYNLDQYRAWKGQTLQFDQDRWEAEQRRMASQ